MPCWIPATCSDHPARSETERWSLLATGDFCPVKHEGDLRDAKPSDSVPWLGQELATLIRKADVAMVNVEGPVEGSGKPSTKAGVNLIIDEGIAAGLGSAGFHLATLANNHIMDYGVEGLSHTQDWFNLRGIKTCGVGDNRAAALQPVYLDIPTGTRIAVVSVCENEFSLADSITPGAAGVSDPDLETVVATARANADVVVVAAHGGCEEVPFPPLQRRAQLRRIIDAGANLIVGHHAHVPQGWELWGDGMILYSLGDFYFRWPDNRSMGARRWSIVAQAHFEGSRFMGVEVYPIESLSDGRVDLVLPDDVAERRVGYLNELAEITASESLTAYWQATAEHLWEDRYRSYLYQSLRCVRSIKQLFRFGVQEVGLWHAKPSKSPAGQLPSDMDYLLLLQLLRTESHRWAIETWTGVASGLTENLINHEIRKEFEHLMNLMRTL